MPESVLLASIYAHHACAVPEDAKRGRQSLSPRVAGGCDLPRECWELDRGPLREQQMLLSIEPFSPSPISSFPLFIQEMSVDCLPRVRVCQEPGAGQLSLSYR